MRCMNWLLWVSAAHLPIIFFANPISLYAGSDKKPTVSGPITHDAVTPHSSDSSAKELVQKKWKPGDPVRVKKDLIESPKPSSQESEEAPTSTQDNEKPE